VAAQVGDIGAELIAILSKGLYTNPLDCLREYAQNGVDAGAKTITIKITGNDASIFDDGSGMTLADLVQAKKFGLSSKSIADHVGFRGIGIYSGFDICRRLVIKSSKRGETDVYTMSFEFAAMKQQLDKERQQASGAKRTSLIELLSNHTSVSREEDGAKADEHFTHVELRDIAPEHIALLLDGAKLQEYLLQNLPIDFAPSFEHGKAINQQLAQHVPGYNPIRVRLQLDNADEVIVQKYNAQGANDAAKLSLSAPKYRTVNNAKGQPVAFYWACLNKARERLEGGKQTPQYEGFVYKVKGFSIGDRNKLRSMFYKRQQLYGWYTGEVYVLDPHVIPNAERNDFETSPAKSALELALQGEFDGLRKDAEGFQAKGKAEAAIDVACATVVSLETETKLDKLEKIRRVQDIIDELPKRKKKAVDPAAQAKADQFLARAKALHKALVKEMNDPAGEVSRRREQSKKDPPQPEAKPAAEEAVAAPPETLGAVFAEAGWEFDEPAAQVLEIVESAIEDLFGAGSDEHQRLMEYIAERLSEAGDGS